MKKTEMNYNSMAKVLIDMAQNMTVETPSHARSRAFVFGKAIGVYTSKMSYDKIHGKATVLPFYEN